MTQSPRHATRTLVRSAQSRGAALLIMLTLLAMASASLLIGSYSRQQRDLAVQRRTLIAFSLVKEALIGYAALHGRLPRPAGADGLEHADPCATEADCTGQLPWRTLSIPAPDTPGRQLYYSVTPEFANAQVLYAKAVATKRVQQRDGGAALRDIAGQAGCQHRRQCVPAVLLASAGPDGLDQGDDAAANRSASVLFIRRAASSDPRAPGGSYADLLDWVPLLPLYNRMNLAGKLP